MRASDPMYEIGLRFGGHKQEDRFWQRMFRGIQRYLLRMELICVDPRLQWSQAKNIWHNAAMRAAMYKMTAPLHWIQGRKR